MKYDFSMTPEQRLAVAEELRGGTLLPPTITPEMEAALAACTVEELSVPTSTGPARVLRVTPPGMVSGLRPMFVNFHGGGFVRPYHRRDTIFCAELAMATGAIVLDVDYKLAPEHPFPTGITESYEVVEWAFANAADMGVDDTRIAVGGHSAGGNFATVICLMAQESGAFRPCAQVLDYPFVDGSTDPADKMDERSIMPLWRMEAFNVLYAGVPENLTDTRLSPVLASLDAMRGMPPALLLLAGMDPLRFEAQRYAARLIAADVDVDVRNFHDCDHGWVVSGKTRHEEARAMIFEWLNRHFAR